MPTTHLKGLGRLLCALALLVTASLLSIAPAQASGGDYQLRYEQEGAALRITTPEGIHVNLQAPLRLTLPSGEDVDGAGVEGHGGAQFPLPAGLEIGAALRVEFSLCDDAETWCKIMKLALRHDPSVAEVVATRAGPVKAPEAPHASAGQEGLHLDFAIQNDAPAAFARAQETGALVLLDFYAVWCPPCQMLARSLNTPEARALLDNIVVLQLDADSPASWDSKSRYQIGGYPTAILARADGQELSRMVGFPGDEALMTWLSEGQSSSHTLKEWADARAKGDRSPETLLGLARALSTQGLDEEATLSYAEALPALSGEDAMEAHGALLIAAARAGDKKALKRHTQALTQGAEGPTSDLFVFYYAARASESERLQTRLFEAAADAAEKALATATAPRERADLLESKAFFLSSLEDEAGAKVAASAAADAWLEVVGALGGTDATSLASFRGEAGSLTGSLADAGRLEEAEAWHRIFTAAYPDEITYHYKYARFLQAQGRTEEAQVAAQAAFDASAGDNRLWAARLLAQLMADNGDSKGATALLERVIRETDLPEDPSLRTHRYVQQLEELRADLTAESAS